jgi:hypothetical protein
MVAGQWTLFYQWDSDIPEMDSWMGGEGMYKIWKQGTEQLYSTYS